MPDRQFVRSVSDVVFALLIWLAHGGGEAGGVIFQFAMYASRYVSISGSNYEMMFFEEGKRHT